MRLDISRNDSQLPWNAIAGPPARSPNTLQIYKLIFINPWIELFRVPFPLHEDFITFTFDNLFSSIYILRRLSELLFIKRALNN